MSDLRKERDRVARRWAITAGAIVVLLIVVLFASQVMKWCARAASGWEYGGYCTPLQTWDWLLDGANTHFWVATAMVVFLVISTLLPDRKQ